MGIQPDRGIIDSLTNEHLYRQSGTKRRHGRSGLRRSRRKKGRDAIRRACADNGIRRQPKSAGDVGAHLRDRRSDCMRDWQQCGVNHFADPVRPASRHGVESGLQGIVAIGMPATPYQPGGDEIRLMKKMARKSVHVFRHEARGAREGRIWPSRDM